MTLNAVNRHVINDQSLLFICHKLYSDYEAINEAKKQQSRMSKVRENPIEENGAMKISFFANRRSIFDSNVEKSRKRAEMNISLKERGTAGSPLVSFSGLDITDSSMNAPIHVSAPSHCKTGDSSQIFTETPEAQLVEKTVAAVSRGIHMANGWQQWTAPLPDGRMYFFHPATQVSQWEAPLEVKERKEVLQGVSTTTDLGKDKSKELRELELYLEGFLKHKELDLVEINQSIHVDSKMQALVKRLCEYGKVRGMRDLGLDCKQGMLKRDFFDTRPHLFQTRVKGMRTLVKIVSSKK